MMLLTAKQFQDFMGTNLVTAHYIATESSSPIFLGKDFRQKTFYSSLCVFPPTCHHFFHSQKGKESEDI